MNRLLALFYVLTRKNFYLIYTTDKISEGTPVTESAWIVNTEFGVDFDLEVLETVVEDFREIKALEDEDNN